MRVRDDPSINGIELGFVKVNENYQLLDKQNNWYKIKFDGKEGFIKSSFAEIIN